MADYFVGIEIAEGAIAEGAIAEGVALYAYRPTAGSIFGRICQ